MQRASNNASAFVTCQQPHYCHRMRPHALVGEWGRAARPVVQAAGAGKIAQLCMPSPFPMAVRGLWGPMVSNHTHRGALRSPLGQQPWKEGRVCHQASAWSHQCRNGHVFSQRVRTFSKASKPNHLWWCRKECCRMSCPRMCTKCMGEGFHTFVHSAEDVHSGPLISPECKHLTDMNLRHQYCSTHLIPLGPAREA